MTWKLYIQKRGPLNHGMRMEQLLGRLSYQVHQAASMTPKRTPADFIRYHDAEPQEPKIATPQDFMRILSAAKVKG